MPMGGRRPSVCDSITGEQMERSPARVFFRAKGSGWADSSVDGTGEPWAIS